RRYGRTGIGQDDVRRERDQLGRIFAHGVGLAVAPAIVETNVLPDGPTRSLQGLRESGHAGLPLGIVRGERREHADASHPPALLRAPRARGGRGRAEERYELAPSHSITSSARPSRSSGRVRPSALAVLRLMMSVYLSAPWIGKSPGLAPLRMRS